MSQFMIRFIAGGAIVSLFAALGDVLKPKTFAGLFGAAPSVAIATLSLTVLTQGNAYAAIEARSMIAGALSFCIYAAMCAYLMIRKDMNALRASSYTLSLWLCCAIGIWYLALK